MLHLSLKFDALRFVAANNVVSLIENQLDFITCPCAVSIIWFVPQTKKSIKSNVHVCMLVGALAPFDALIMAFHIHW